MRRLLFIYICSCLLFPSAAFCWWETGHQTVARIAASLLTAGAQAKVAEILGVANTPDAVSDAMAKASTWADETKAETGTGDWHFIDLALQDTKANIPDRCSNDNCVTARITLFARQLKTSSNLEALRYLIHFVGDIHQPLHAVSDADLGGNCELLNPTVGKAKNLHALWDGEIIDEMNMSDKELAASLEQQLTTEQQQKLAAGSADDWAWESHELAIADIYQKLHIPVEPIIFPKSCANAPSEITQFRTPVDGLYINSMKPVIQEQLLMGGVRLAKLLNDVF